MSRTRKRLVLAAGALAAAAAVLVFVRRDNAWDIKNERPHGSRIVAFGDSLTAGYQMAAGQSYPDYLSRFIGRPVVNRGVSGDTTADGLARLESDVLADDPRIVLVCLGGNDMLRRLPADQQFTNLRTIVERIQSRGALVILVGVEGLQLLGTGDYGGRYRDLARETGAVYVPDLLDGVLSDPRLMHDRIHPNAAGYEKIALRLARDVGDYLKR